MATYVLCSPGRGPRRSDWEGSIPLLLCDLSQDELEDGRMVYRGSLRVGRIGPSMTLSVKVSGLGLSGLPSEWLLVASWPPASAPDPDGLAWCVDGALADAWEGRVRSARDGRLSPVEHEVAEVMES